MSESSMIVVEDRVIEARPPQPLADAAPLRLAWRALLLDEHAYDAVVGATRPLQRGFVALLWVLGIVLLGRLVGLGLNWLTSPQLGGIETQLREFITSLPWYADQVRQAPGFAAEFAQNYFLGWEGLRAVLGIQTPTSTGVWAGVTLLDTLLAWLFFGLLALWSARWMGGQGRWQQTLGAVALAYAPLLLTLIEVIPGAALPLSLLFLAMLVGKYQAIKVVHGLTSGYVLAVVLIPYLLSLLLLLGVSLFGGAYGLEQVPYINQAIETLRGAFALWGMR